jgi:hypothetical protein
MHFPYKRLKSSLLGESIRAHHSYQSFRSRAKVAWYSKDPFDMCADALTSSSTQCKFTLSPVVIGLARVDHDILLLQ